MATPSLNPPPDLPFAATLFLPLPAVVFLAVGSYLLLLALVLVLRQCLLVMGRNTVWRPVAFVPTAVPAKRGHGQACVNAAWPVQSHVTVSSLLQLVVWIAVVPVQIAVNQGLALSLTGVRSVIAPVHTSPRTVRASIAFALKSNCDKGSQPQNDRE